MAALVAVDGSVLTGQSGSEYLGAVQRDRLGGFTFLGPPLFEFLVSPFELDGRIDPRRFRFRVAVRGP